ncbi:hypothetical protein NDU88_007305 [Pleurodeles waltl]|uniref:Uncharacterized protein n=1 Tax=Pleurodeles waltl TaxID=8319 RepID=A0AAV7NX04_PLEWA|nr:hypothetical protein NDU88_007305 [Pleurodeles waltl]
MRRHCNASGKGKFPDLSGGSSDRLALPLTWTLGAWLGPRQAAWSGCPGSSERGLVVRRGLWGILSPGSGVRQAGWGACRRPEVRSISVGASLPSLLWPERRLTRAAAWRGAAAWRELGRACAERRRQPWLPTLAGDRAEVAARFGFWHLVDFALPVSPESAGG